MKAVLKAIWENRKGILEGVKNSIIRDELVEDIARMSHSHPTYAEAVKEAALAASENRALHI